MVFSFQPIIDWLGTLFNKFLTDVSLKYVAFKTLVYTFITVTLPAVLKNMLAWLFGLLTAQVDQFDWGSMSDVVVEFSGLAAWFAVHLRFLDCLAVLITALVISFNSEFYSFCRVILWLFVLSTVFPVPARLSMLSGILSITISRRFIRGKSLSKAFFLTFFMLFFLF